MKDLLLEIKRLNDILDKYRYAVSFAGADSWDMGLDTKIRLQWAKSNDLDLLDWDNNKIASIAKQFHKST